MDEKRTRGKEKIEETETVSGKGRLADGPTGGGKALPTRTAADWLATDADRHEVGSVRIQEPDSISKNED